MTLASLNHLLTQHPEKRLAFQLPDGKLVPPHFHLTELGLVTKEMVDCGGVRRSVRSCMLQLFVANDVDHSMPANKLSGILSHADKIGLKDEDLVECEYEAEHLSIFQLQDPKITEVALIFQLADKHTACLSPDKCGLDEFGNPTTGCC